MNMYIWEIGASNKPFIRGSYTEIKFSKKWSSYWQTCIISDRSIFTPHSVSTFIFDRVVLYGNNSLSLVVLSSKK